MKTVKTAAGLRSEISGSRREGKRVGFVPTMGFLHEGHLSLVRRSRSECAVTVASIFVNPTQFAPGEDFERYPRDADRDTRLLVAEGTDLLFMPEASEIYRPGHSTWVEVTELDSGLCGPFRPGHFRGVATVVAKLFNIVRPDAAYFGQKDAQQAAILARMEADLDFGIDIVVCPTVREADGLALSSRNVYLSADERRRAPALYQALREAAEMAAGRGASPAGLETRIRARLVEAGLEPQYIEIVGADDLRPLDSLGGAGRSLLVAVAAHLGKTRLIDNIIVSV
ncbi:MAG: pantoate--beta-alanine ligase [Acidobacteria bacterium]|nr:pantoate--beta-alanine ligase [Acidobacteriota bacterium]